MPFQTALPTGVTFECLENCGFCCMFQVELRNWERPRGRVASRTNNGLIDMSGKHCAFFDRGKCRVYENRPTICRLYPFNLHISTSPQISVDLSCPGVSFSSGGEPDLEWLTSLYPEGLIEEMISSHSERWLELVDGAGGEPDRLSLSDEALDSALEKSWIPPVEEYPAVTDEARLYPVYDHNSQCLSVYTLIYWRGRMEWRDYLDWNRVLCSFRTPEALAVDGSFSDSILRDYAHLLSSRDSVLGYALLLYGRAGDDLQDIYRDVLAGILDRVLFEARALALLRGEGSVSTGTLFEAIRFHDHTVFVLPTYGLWL